MSTRDPETTLALPMTTVFTESDFCTELYAEFAKQTHTSIPTISRSWASDDTNHGACHPYDEGTGPFSPGWYCPAGFETVSTEIYESGSYRNVYCCPSGYTYDIYCFKTTSDVRVYTTDPMLEPYWLTLPTAVVKADEWWLKQPLGVVPPPTPAPTGGSATETGGADSSATDGSSTDNGDGNGSGGLSTGAKAGIGVGVAAIVIILLVGLLFMWLSKKRSKKNTPADAGDLTGAHGPELDGTGKAGEYNGNLDIVPTQSELPASEKNVGSGIPVGEELEDTQRLELEATRAKELEEAQKAELEAAQRLELGGAQRMELNGAQRVEIEGAERLELDGAQRLELEAQERQRHELEAQERQRHELAAQERQKRELETGMSATVRDVPELMYSAEYYELEGPKNDTESGSQQVGSEATPQGTASDAHLSELQQIEAEEERLKKRRADLLAQQQ